MKTLFALLFLFVLSFAVMARQTASDSTEKRTFVGVGLSTTAYQVMGKPKYDYIGGVIPILNISYGYRLSNRATLQIGLGYGGNEIGGGSIGRYISADSISEKETYQLIRAIVTPVTFKFTPFNPNRRLQLYVNASLVPVFGHIKARATESFKDDVTVLYDEKLTSVTLIATAGLTLNYKISKRLDGYMDGILFYKNLNFPRPARRFYENKSVGIGINYNL